MGCTVCKYTNKLNIHAPGYSEYHINFGLSDDFGAEGSGSTGVGLGGSMSEASKIPTKKNQNGVSCQAAEKHTRRVLHPACHSHY